MARTVKSHDERKSEILDTAQMLFYKNGYENTSVAQVIEAIDIAKGTFYHYFKSKAELLDQIVERIAANIDAIIDKVLEEPEENAIVELNNIYREIGQYKAMEKNVLIMMTKALYNDNNIILLSKLTKRRFETVAPRLAQVIVRGKKEGVFNTGVPDIVASLILNMGAPLSNEFAKYVLDDQLNENSKKEYMQLCDCYEKAVERVLGASEGSINLFERDTITKFFE
jgi:AcrR family transcriptional regulator